MRYRVEMKYFYGWDDARWTDEADAASWPLRFDTAQAAQADLNIYLAQVKAAVVAGDMDIEDNPTDYRIVEVSG